MRAARFSYDVITEILGVFVVWPLTVGCAWLLFRPETERTPVVVIGLGLALAEGLLLGILPWTNPHSLELSVDTLVASWRFGRTKSFPRRELRFRRRRTVLSIMCGAEEVVDRQGRLVLRVWPQLQGYRALRGALGDE